MLLPNRICLLSARRRLCSIGGRISPLRRDGPTLTLHLGRSFHVSSHVQSPAIYDASLQTFHGVFESLHSATGLPWAVSLPLAAFLLRAVLVAPLSVAARRESQKATACQPLVHAWAYAIQRQFQQKSPLSADKKLHRRLYMAELRQKRHEVFRAFEVHRWVALLPLLQLPLWLAQIEVVRQMCGFHAGLFGWLANAMSSTSSISDADPTLPAVAVEPSLETGGILWFPDLLVPDPQLLLPFILAGALWYNVSRTQKSWQQAGTDQTKRSRSTLVVIKLIALLAVPLTLQVPAAMQSYWVCSAASGTLQNIIIERLMPLPQIPKRIPPETHSYLSIIPSPPNR